MRNVNNNKSIADAPVLMLRDTAPSDVTESSPIRSPVMSASLSSMLVVELSVFGLLGVWSEADGADTGIAAVGDSDSEEISVALASHGVKSS